MGRTHILEGWIESNKLEVILFFRQRVNIY